MELNLATLSNEAVNYDEDFIKNEYLPKLNFLSNCLERGAFPCNIQEI